MMRLCYCLLAASLFTLSALMPPARGSLTVATARQRFVGTIVIDSIGANFVTSFNPLGSATQPVASPAFGQTLSSDSPLALDGRGHYFADLAATIPSTSNGGIRLVHGNTVVTVQLKPGQHWSDGSLIGPTDYIGALLVFSSPTNARLCPGATRIISVTATASSLVLTFTGSYGPVLDGCIPEPLPIEYMQRKYGLRLPTELLTAFDAARVRALYASPSYAHSTLGKFVTAVDNDPYTTPADVFSGPYKIARFRYGVVGAYAANPYYTALPADPHHARPATIAYVVGFRDYSSFLRGVLAPQAYRRYDLAEVFHAADLPALRRTRFRISFVAGSALNLVQFNLANPALRDPRVRQALSLAVDRVAYLRGVYPQLSADELQTLLCPAPVSCASPWSIYQRLAKNPYDPTRARRLLAATGYATRPGEQGRHLHLDFYTSSSAPDPTSGRLLQQFWRAIGVTVRLHLRPEYGLNGIYSSYAEGGIAARRDFDILERWDFENPDPEWLLSAFDPSQIPDQIHPFDPNQIPDYLFPQATNFGGVQDVPLIRALTQAQYTIDQAQRYRLYAWAQRRIIDQAYWMPLYDDPKIRLVKPTVGNYQAGTYTDANWNAYAWYRNG